MWGRKAKEIERLTKQVSSLLWENGQAKIQVGVWRTKWRDSTESYRNLDHRLDNARGAWRSARRQGVELGIESIGECVCIPKWAAGQIDTHLDVKPRSTNPTRY